MVLQVKNPVIGLLVLVVTLLVVSATLQGIIVWRMFQTSPRRAIPVRVTNSEIPVEVTNTSDIDVSIENHEIRSFDPIPVEIVR